MNMHNNRETFEQADLIQKACSMLGWRDDPQKIAEKVKQLQRGLPKEDEFAALSVWMGKCSLIHKLEQEQFPSLSREKYQVPDFFAVFNVSNKDIPALIEIKKTKDIKIGPFTSAYYGKLTNYASLLKLPLLIAWHIEKLNLWCLFDHERMQRKQTAFHIDFQTAMNNNLLGILFDDVIITLEPGNRILLRYKKETGSERRDANGKLQKFAGILEEIIWFSSKDEKIALNSALGKLLNLIFYLVDNDVTETEDEKYVTLTFHTTRKEYLFTHQLLGVVAFGTAILSNDKPNWLEVIKRNRFRMGYQSVRSALSTGVKEGAVSMIIRQNPAFRPKFLEI